MNWTDNLGLHFLERGALSYIIEKDSNISWNGMENVKQKIDMVILECDHVKICELKETDAVRRKKISFQQIERYYYICRDARYKTEFWVFVYWKNYGVVTGVKMNKVENLQVYAIGDNNLEFFASIGLDPETRERRKVDMVLKL